MLRSKLKYTLWFTAQFQQLHHSGLGFAESLALLEKSCPDPAFAHIIQRIVRSVKKGRAFSLSLKPYPDYFSETYLAMVAVGEESGHLSQVFQELSAYLTLHLRLRQSLIQALTYPCLILVLMLGMLVFLLWFVIPQFEAIFAQFKTPLPGLTLGLFTIVHHLKAIVFSLILGGVVGLIFLKKPLYQAWKRIQHQSMLLRCPGIGPYYHDWLLMFLFKTLSLSLRSGLSLQQAFALLPRLFAATPFAQLIRLMQQDLQEGQALEKIFYKKEYIPEIGNAYIRIASVSGALDEQLQQLALHFETRVYHKINQLKILLEPCILLVTGGLVGLIVIALYQPLFSLGGLV